MAESFAAFEFAGWEQAAAKYDLTWAALTRLFITPLLQAVRAGPNVRLLDVACGPGYVTAEASRLGATVTGLDFSPNMVGVARARHPTLTFQTGDAQALPFPDGSFDAVCMNFGLLHLPNPERGLTEAARVLRRGGHYAFTVWAGPDESPADAAIESVVERLANPDVGLPAGPPRFGFGTTAAARATLGSRGFRPETVTVQPAHVTWRIPSTDFLFEAERDAGVRMSGLLRAQTPEVLEAIRRGLAERLEAFRTADGLALPYVAHVISATA
ncbi:MAG TPA: class I SAM-dependent methyltransferase [Gemmatimonadales bacterium]|nr:class I SAM-dependent methyltransferase [Gemmatimonadales bacterium]